MVSTYGIIRYIQNSYYAQCGMSCLSISLTLIILVLVPTLSSPLHISSKSTNRGLLSNVKSQHSSQQCNARWYRRHKEGCDNCANICAGWRCYILIISNFNSCQLFAAAFLTCFHSERWTECRVSIMIIMHRSAKTVMRNQQRKNRVHYKTVTKTNE